MSAAPNQRQSELFRDWPLHPKMVRGGIEPRKFRPRAMARPAEGSVLQVNENVRLRDFVVAGDSHELLFRGTSPSDTAPHIPKALRLDNGDLVIDGVSAAHHNILVRFDIIDA